MNKLHIFCGPIYHEGWVNMDISPAHKTDILGDVLQTHFDDNTWDAIYGCHGLEHLRYSEDVVECLNRFYRWLKSGGILRISVPNLELAVNAYVTIGDLKFLYSPDFKGYYYKDCKAERLNFFVKAWEHTICFDFELLSSLFADAGFKNIQQKKPNESLIPGFCYDRMLSESLYIEATK